jgi:hypothetical protein
MTQARIDELQWTLDQLALSREATDYLQVSILYLIKFHFFSKEFQE